MAAQFRCVGRLYPNGPPSAVVGCDGRVGPRILQLQWLNGVGVAEPGNGVWHNCYYSSFLVNGWDPRINWNAEVPVIRGININVQVEQPSVVYLYADLQHRRPDGSIGHNVYRQTFNGGGLDWGQQDIFILDHFETVGGPSPVEDSTIFVRRGTYSRIPPSSCIGA